MLISWLIKSTIGRIVGGVMLALCAGVLLWGTLQVRGCIKAKAELQQYHLADKVVKQDKKTDQKIQENKDAVDGFSTPDDFSNGFDKLRDYGTHK